MGTFTLIIGPIILIGVSCFHSGCRYDDQLIDCSQLKKIDISCLENDRCMEVDRLFLGTVRNINLWKCCLPGLIHIMIKDTQLTCTEIQKNVPKNITISRNGMPCKRRILPKTDSASSTSPLPISSRKPVKINNKGNGRTTMTTTSTTVELFSGTIQTTMMQNRTKETISLTTGTGTIDLFVTITVLVSLTSLVIGCASILGIFRLREFFKRKRNQENDFRLKTYAKGQEAESSIIMKELDVDPGSRDITVETLSHGSDTSEDVFSFTNRKMKVL